MPSSRIVTTMPRPVMFFLHTGVTLISNPLGPTVCPTKKPESIISLNSLSLQCIIQLPASGHLMEVGHSKEFVINSLA